MDDRKKGEDVSAYSSLSRFSERLSTCGSCPLGRVCPERWGTSSASIHQDPSLGGHKASEATVKRRSLSL